MIEQKIDRLNDSVLQLTVAIRELTDVYVGVVEAGEASRMLPAAVKIRNRRKDKNSEFREYSLLDARSIFMDWHRSVGELEAEKFLKSFNATTVTNLADEDINRFVHTLKEKMALTEK